MGNSLACCCRRSREDAHEYVDLYGVLGVAPTATRDQIDAAMRRVRQAHGPGSGGDAKLYDQAMQAYAVLSDPHRRAQYDEALETKRGTGVEDYSTYSPPRHTEPVSGDPLPPSETSGISTAVEYVGGFDPDDGFQAAKTSHGLWNEPALLQNRIASDELVVMKLFPSGSFGEVRMGKLSGSPVVLKQLKKDEQNTSKAVVWATEIVRMTKLSHPKIAKFVGVEWNKQWGTRAVVEYMPLRDLRAMLSSPKATADLDWAGFKCQVAMDVVDALAYLQANTAANVVMDSFTSRNVLLEDQEGHCKLSIFAAARGQRDVRSSPYYMEWVAPEIILRKDSSDPAKSTIYSLGVLLCELDTAKPPFYDAVNPNGSPMAPAKITQQVAFGKLRPSVSDECPEGIALLASECVAFDPQARPTTTNVAYRLRDILKNEL